MLEHNHPRGTICVAREVHRPGNWQWLALADQWAYKEWGGCFSVL